MDSQYIPNVNLKLLQSFLMVAEHGSFRTAAAHLNRSHSAISAQVAQLEAQLGVQLFWRTTRVVKLTDEGRQLTGYARNGLHEITLGMRQIREAADIKNGRVSIACVSSIASSYLPAVLVDFIRQFPSISVTIRELISPDIVIALDENKIDFAIGPELQEQRFHFDIILREPLYAIVPISLVDSRCSEITLKEVAELPLLLSTSATAMRSILEDAASRLGIELNSHYQFIQMQTIIAMAKAGLGAAILPSTLVTEISDQETIRVLRIAEPFLERRMAIITRRDQTLSPTALSLSEKIKSHILEPPIGFK